MTLIILLVCLFLQTFLNINEKLRGSHLFDRYIENTKPVLSKLGLNKGWPALVVLMLPLLILIAVASILFSHFWPLYLLFGILVVLCCLDARDLKIHLSDYFAALSSNNINKTQIEAELFVNHPVSQDKAQITRAVTEGVFTRSLTDIFSVIFWFVVLGPFGAVLYRLSAALYQYTEKNDVDLVEIHQHATLLKNILDWIPVRLVALTFALIGHFGPVFALWVDRLGGGLNDNRAFIVDAGLTALNVDTLEDFHPDITENYSALGLANRALWTWIIIIAVLTVTTWVF